MFQVSPDTSKLQIGFISILCILISVSACSILCRYYRSVPYIKKNILTRLDELLVLSYTFFICFQCFVCLLSVMCEARNDYVYLAFYIILYGSLAIAFGITIGLSFCRVLIIMSVSNEIIKRLEVCIKVGMQVVSH